MARPDESRNKMNYASIKRMDVANGPGVRMSLFVGMSIASTLNELKEQNPQMMLKELFQSGSMGFRVRKAIYGQRN